MPQSFHLFLVLFFSILHISAGIGVNWGTTASHPLPPAKVVELLKSNNISKVKLFDANPLLLQALSGSSIGVTVGIPNSMLKSFNSSKKIAEIWVHDNLTRFLSTSTSTPKLRIEYVAVGDDPFHQSNGEQFKPFVIGAAMNIQIALTRANLASQVKVIVPCSYDSYQSDSGLPSKGHFRPDLNKTMIELLTFLTKHQSPFFVTISPFLTFRQNKNVSLDFTLFKGSTRPHNDTHRSYKNTFDLNYDILVNALSTIGFHDISIIISKIGWPTDGAPNATSSIAETFLKGLTDHLSTKSGTPLRPRNPPSEVYIDTLLDEDQRSIVTGNFERHWGIFTFDGQAKYQVDFGKGLKKLVNAENIEYLPPKWCVLDNNKELGNASARALDACLGGDCTALSPGGSCFNMSWPGNISYAFNSYYQLHDQRSDSCEFGGLGLITSVDPSVGNCRFSIQLQISSSRDTLALPYSSQWLLLLILMVSFYNMLDNL